jgi:uncharacterized protein YwqG
MQTIEEKVNNLPSELDPYKELILSTKKEFVSIELQKKDNLSFITSKVGGVGYLPLGTEYPRSKSGEYLALLAQINFSEMPPLENYPREGILQFYIAEDDYGMDYDNLLEGDIKVIFHKTIEAHQSDFSFLDDFRADSILPINPDIELKMNFTLDAIVISAEDFRFEKVFDKNFYDFFDSLGENGEALFENYQKIFGEALHKVGGYPYFTQEDPRYYVENNYQDYTELLFQLDSDDAENEILWGDVGIGNFFIKPEDLKKRDFSKVLYTWDCH